MKSIFRFTYKSKLSSDLPLITWATVTASPPPPLLTVPPSKWLKFTLIPLSDSILT